MTKSDELKLLLALYSIKQLSFEYKEFKKILKEKYHAKLINLHDVLNMIIDRLDLYKRIESDRKFNNYPKYMTKNIKNIIQQLEQYISIIQNKNKFPYR